MIREEIVKSRKEFANIIASVLDGTISAAEALDKWPNSKQGIDSSIDCAYHALIHFRDDIDIHKKDETYKNLQLSELREMYNYLILGKDISKKQKDFYTPHTIGSFLKKYLQK